MKIFIKYFLPLILVMVVGLLFLFDFFPFKPKPETTAHIFGGQIVDVGNDGINSFITVKGVPLLDDSTLEPPKNWEDRKIILDSDTKIEKYTSILSISKRKDARAGKVVSINESDIEKEVTNGLFSDFKKGMEILAFSEDNIFFKKEFKAKKIQINIFDF